MTRTYLVVIEKGTDGGWSAFAPDVPGTGGMGDSAAEAVTSLRAGIGYLFEDIIKRGLPIPAAVSTIVNFSEFDPNPDESHYEIEWLTVTVRELAGTLQHDAQQAA